MKYVLLLFAFILLGCKEDVSADMKHFLSAGVLIPKHKMINCSDSVGLGIDEQNYIYCELHRRIWLLKMQAFYDV